MRARNVDAAIELVVDAAWRDGFRYANEQRDAELLHVLQLGRERDPGGYEPWDPRDRAANADRRRRERDWQALMDLQRELDQADEVERAEARAAAEARRAELRTRKKR